MYCTKCAYVWTTMLALQLLILFVSAIHFRDHKHFMCFCQFFKLENEICSWNPTQNHVFPQLFLVLRTNILKFFLYETNGNEKNVSYFLYKTPQKRTGMFASSTCISSPFLSNYIKLHFLTDFSPILQMSVLLYGYPDGTEPPILFGSYRTLVNALLLVYMVSSILIMLVCKEGCFVPCSRLYCSVITFGTFVRKKKSLIFSVKFFSFRLLWLKG